MGRRHQLSFFAFAGGMTLGPIVVASLGIGLAGCRQRYFVPAGNDAAADATGSDGLAPLTLDIAVTGCAAFDTAAVACSGTAPLSVSFSPVGSPELTTFLWTFGDGSAPSSERAPMHTYTLPGSYDVKVTGRGTVGTLMQLRRSLIVLRPVATGAPCDVDGQCGNGLHCLCQPGTGCGAAFLRGLCTTGCETGFCGVGAVCAAYTPANSADAGADAPLCLAGCRADSDCAPGFACEELPAGASTTTNWVRGCLPLGAAGDLGASCRNANDQLDGTRCTTGRCADLGALGICSAGCDESHPCPAGAGCAHFDGGQQICLVACSAAQPCSSDPSLDCEPGTSSDAGADGGTRFRVVGGDAAAPYCAPR